MKKYKERIDLYVFSGNGDKSATRGSGEVRFYNMRPQGFLYDPSKYEGCVLSLASFQSLPMPLSSVVAMCKDTPIYTNSSIHFQILEAAQPNSISNFNASSGGVSSYSSNAGILQTLEWDNALTLTGNSGSENNVYALKYRSSDPLAEGVYISNPLETFTVRIINSNNDIVNLSNTTNDDNSGGTVDTSWSAHIIIQPILKAL